MANLASILALMTSLSKSTTASTAKFAQEMLNIENPVENLTGNELDEINTSVLNTTGKIPAKMDFVVEPEVQSAMPHKFDRVYLEAQDMGVSPYPKIQLQYNPGAIKTAAKSNYDQNNIAGIELDGSRWIGNGASEISWTHSYYLDDIDQREGPLNQNVSQMEKFLDELNKWYLEPTSLTQEPTRVRVTFGQRSRFLYRIVDFNYDILVQDRQLYATVIKYNITLRREPEARGPY